MNKTVKIIVIAAAVSLAAGAVIAVIGFTLGGKSAMSLRFGNGGGGVQTEIAEETIEFDEFNALAIEVSSVDVSIVTGDKYSLSYKTRKGHEPEVEQSGKSLSVKQPSRVEFVIFDFGFGADLDTYTITVPEGSEEIKAGLKSSSGDFIIDRVNISGEVKTSSGDISLNDTEGSGLAVTSSSGSVMFNGVGGSELTVSTSSGDIDGDKVKADEISISTSSGEASFLRTEAGSMTCASSSGDISIFESEIGGFSCETSSGEVEMGLMGDAGAYSFDITASSGDIVVNGNETEKKFEQKGSGEGSITIRTSSGDVDVTVAP